MLNGGAQGHRLWCVGEGGEGGGVKGGCWVACFSLGGVFLTMAFLVVTFGDPVKASFWEKVTFGDPGHFW
jgi:hypothetical protein